MYPIQIKDTYVNKIVTDNLTDAVTRNDSESNQVRQNNAGPY